MKKFNNALLAAILIVVAACNNSPKKTTESSKSAAIESVVETKSILSGTFEGTMPAADCEGIHMVLTVNSDTTYTYTLKREYIGVENGLFEASGVFNVLEDGLIELIKPSSGDKIYFKRVADNYMLSDSLGTVNKGELAEYYILKKR